MASVIDVMNSLILFFEKSWKMEVSDETSFYFWSTLLCVLSLQYLCVFKILEK